MPYEKDKSSMDLHVGQQMANRRVSMRLRRSDLGHMLNASEFEIAQWEQGLVRISASKLFQISCVLKVPVSYFFELYLNN